MTVTSGMRAITYDRYGGSDVLRLTDLPEPKVGPDSVLVRVRAASVNPVDWKVRAGYLDQVLDVDFPAVPGWDVAGVVDAAARDELGGHYVWVRPSTTDLDALGRLVDDGAVKVDVARVFDLADTAAAHDLVAEGHVRGKVVVRV